MPPGHPWSTASLQDSQQTLSLSLADRSPCVGYISCKFSNCTISAQTWDYYFSTNCLEMHCTVQNHLELVKILLAYFLQVTVSGKDGLMSGLSVNWNGAHNLFTSKPSYLVLFKRMEGGTEPIAMKREGLCDEMIFLFCRHTKMLRFHSSDSNEFFILPSENIAKKAVALACT